MLSRNALFKTKKLFLEVNLHKNRKTSQANNIDISI